MSERIERLEQRTMMSAVHAVLRPPPFPSLVGDHTGVYDLDAMRLVGPGPAANLDEIMADLDVTQ